MRFSFESKKPVYREYGGRGLYVCPYCLSKRKEKVRKRFGIDAMEVKKQLERQIVNLLQLGWRSRVIRIGVDDTLKELKAGKKGFLILATDISKRTKRNILYKYDGEYFEFLPKEYLGKLLGKREVGVIFIPDTKFGKKVKEKLEKYLEIM